MSWFLHIKQSASLVYHFLFIAFFFCYFLRLFAIKLILQFVNFINLVNKNWKKGTIDFKTRSKF